MVDLAAIFLVRLRLDRDAFGTACIPLGMLIPEPREIYMKRGEVSYSTPRRRRRSRRMNSILGHQNLPRLPWQQINIGEQSLIDANILRLCVEQLEGNACF